MHRQRLNRYRGRVRKGLVGTVGLVAAAAALAGCGPGNAPSAEPSIDGETSVAPVPGKFVGECGSVTDGQVATASGLGRVQLVTRNPLRCRWETATAGSDVEFGWFRAATIADHHPPGTAPAPATVQLAGQQATVWQGANSCEVAVPSGGADFISWTVDDPNRSGAQICSSTEHLAALTVSKAP
jgi:hypothetical protein